jgi:hypothetical protein
MASYESRHVVATAQYPSAPDNPFVVTDLEREGDDMRRYIFGGAHWSRLLVQTQVEF